MNNKDELYHYGVAGMKWKGHVYATREELKNTIRQYKEGERTARNEYIASRPVRSIIGGYLAGGFGAASVAALASGRLVLRGKMRFKTMSKIVNAAAIAGSTAGVVSAAYSIRDGKKSLNNRVRDGVNAE